MSYIPSHAMPHAYVHEDDEEGNGAGKRQGAGRPSRGLMLGGAAALVGYLLYRALR